MVSPNENLKIMAIGGPPEVGVPENLLRQSVELSGAEKPSVLVIPTARPNEGALERSVEAYGGFFRDTLGIEVKVLHDFNLTNPYSEMAEKIRSADVAYISGGDTDRMMQLWRESGIADLLSEAALNGLVISGVSAGAIAPFTLGHSDSLEYRLPKDPNWDFIGVNGLGLVDGTITPHYDSKTDYKGKSRAQSFRDFILRENVGGVSLGICNDSALEIMDGTATVRGDGNGISRIIPTEDFTGLRVEPLGRGETVEL